MPVISSIKRVSPRCIGCTGRVTVTLGLTAAPELLTRPSDIVLVLDRSCSMSCGLLASVKQGAAELIDLAAEASGGKAGRCIGGGSRMGIVSFSTCARTESGLTADVPALRAAVDRLEAGGRTNHAQAFDLARELLDTGAERNRILVLFTDGVNTEAGDPSLAAARARAQGITVYCIGLNADRAVLNDWATDPDEDHVAVTEDPRALRALFARLGSQIVGPGARDVVVEEVISPEFRLARLGRPTHGRAEETAPGVVRWTMDALGTAAWEQALLTLELVHRGGQGGVKAVDLSTTYRDRAGSHVVFPEAAVTVDCGSPCPEPCTPGEEFCMEPCQSSIAVDLGNTCLQAQGRMIRLNTTLKNICPHKRVALAVWLTELGPCGEERPRGMQMYTIPAHREEGCRDVEVRCIRFAVPEDPDGCGCAPDALCDARSFRVRVLAHYIDTDFLCCP